MRAYLEAGVMVSAGTDAPVVPYPPLWVLHHFVTRETISGGVFRGGPAGQRGGGPPAHHP